MTISSMSIDPMLDPPALSAQRVVVTGSGRCALAAVGAIKDTMVNAPAAAAVARAVAVRCVVAVFMMLLWIVGLVAPVWISVVSSAGIAAAGARYRAGIGWALAPRRGAWPAALRPSCALSRAKTGYSQAT